MDNERRYALGVLLVVVGGLFLSANGIMLRSLEAANGWQVLFYRGLAFTLALFLILLVRYRKNTAAAFSAVGVRGLWAGLVLGLGSCAYIFALLHTTIANAVFIIGAAPLATACAAWLVLRERISITGIVAMLVSLAGIALMFADGLIAGRWLGNVMALLVVASFVVYLLILRDKRDTDMLPACCLGGVVMAVAGFAGADTLEVSTNDMLISIAMGCVTFLIGFICFTVATRYILAAEVALFALTESILAPIWVWIGVGEAPSALTLIGSGVVLVSVTVYCLIEIARERNALRGSTVG
ncbi:MAG: DMT family transporter [Pseudomonadota bacterium]